MDDEGDWVSGVGARTVCPARRAESREGAELVLGIVALGGQQLQDIAPTLTSLAKTVTAP